MLNAHNIEAVKSKVSEFIVGYSPLATEISVDHIWYRARRCQNNTEFNSLYDLIYPQNGSADFGRAQLPKSKVLYASWNPMTATEELGPQVDDVIQGIGVRPIEGVRIPCLVVGAIQFYHASGRPMINSNRIVEFLQGFKEKILSDITYPSTLTRY